MLFVENFFTDPKQYRERHRCAGSKGRGTGGGCSCAPLGDGRGIEAHGDLDKSSERANGERPGYFLTDFEFIAHGFSLVGPCDAGDSWLFAGFSDKRDVSHNP